MSRLDIRYLKNGEYVKAARTAVDTGGTPSTSTPHLAINMPDLADYRDAKWVVAHQFVPYPIIDGGGTGDRWPDYIDDNFMPPGNKNNTGTTYAKHGGRVRQRLLPRISPRLGDGYEITDMETEIDWAVEGYLDGFTIDILQAATLQRGLQVTDFVTAMNNAAPAYFKLWLMPDGSASFCTSQTAEAAADQCAAWINQAPAIHMKINDRYVVAPYGPEILQDTKDTLIWFTAFRTRLTTVLGHVPYVWNCYSRDWLGTYAAPKLDSIADAHGFWGSQNPITTAGTGVYAQGAAAECTDRYGKPFMHFARPQDTRPHQLPTPVFWEAGNTDLFRASMLAAILGDAAMWQFTTWNDFYEDSGVGPSTLGGKIWLDIAARYIARFKTGIWPTIVRDTLYLSHRNQFSWVNSSAEVSSTEQTVFMTQKDATTCPARDEIEALVYITAPCEVRFYRDPAGGTNYAATPYQTTTISTVATTPVPGEHAIKAPLATGSFKAEIWRSGSKVADTTSTSREPVVTTPLVEQKTYMITGSRGRN